MRRKITSNPNPRATLVYPSSRKKILPVMARMLRDVRFSCVSWEMGGSAPKSEGDEAVCSRPRGSNRSKTEKQEKKITQRGYSYSRVHTHTLDAPDVFVFIFFLPTLPK